VIFFYINGTEKYSNAICSIYFVIFFYINGTEKYSNAICSIYFVIFFSDGNGYLGIKNNQLIILSGLLHFVTNDVSAQVPQGRHFINRRFQPPVDARHTLCQVPQGRHLDTGLAGDRRNIDR
jgi:hypothetical protein